MQAVSLNDIRVELQTPQMIAARRGAGAPFSNVSKLEYFVAVMFTLPCTATFETPASDSTT
jgi:hypothetical protein